MPEQTRILIVDDDPGLLRLLSLRLKAAGYEAISADSGEAALAQLETARPQLVITDLQMDGMDGLALLERVHRSHPALPVILLTAHGSIPDAVEATRKGAFEFLTKPFDAQVLLELIEKALAVSGISPGRTTTQPDWHSSIITRNPEMQEILGKVGRIAQTPASVLIQGASGTGKELIAQAIHQASPRADNPFIAINCAAIPEALLESELFGHQRGSFTGADKHHEGLFRAADGGTLFLDEIGEMPLPVQAKLLRVLQEKQLRPVGSTVAIDIDVRIVSASNLDLEDAAENQQFREDLLYRLNVVTLELPTLEQRREDIPLLAKHFLDNHTAPDEKGPMHFAPEALELLTTAQWRGNVRQLMNVVDQAAALSTSALVTADLVGSAIRTGELDILPFAEAKREFEQAYLAKILKIANGNVAQAARLANRNRTEFYKMMERNHLNPADFRE